MRVSLLLLPFFSIAQEWTELKSISLQKTPISYSADIQGNFFISFSDGSLEKRNSGGKLLENFSLSNNSPISLIDVQNNLRPFLFYFDIQRITILDRFSSVPKTYHLSDFGVQIGMMACPAPDGDIWVLENNPQRLKKINPLRKSVVLEVQISIGDNIRKVQAYQNFLFIADEEGLHFFDQFGGALKTLEIKGLTGFQIITSKLYAYTSSHMYTINMDYGDHEDILELPKQADGVLRLNDQFLLIREKQITYFKLTE